jgi:serpin B
MKILVLALLLLSIVIGCTKQQEPAPGNIPMTEKSLQLVKSDNDFGFKLFTALPVDRTHNLMISPFSISMALSMTLNGAKGDTKTAMVNTLGFEGLTPEEINQVYLDLVNALKKTDDKVILNVANSIWIKEGFPVLDSFVKVNQQFYEASVQNLPFDQTAVQTINNWVNSKTNGKIPTILDSISPEEIMFLINAIYFNGKWQIQFDPSKTINTSFTLADGSTVSVPMMKLKEKFGFSEQSSYKALKMPYGRGKFEMVLLLPEPGTAPEEIIKQFNRSKWETLLSSLNNQAETDVWIPRFEYSWEMEMKQILSSLGMGIAFTDQADFSQINANQPLLLTRVKHKTYIKVNEEGTEAAAVTSVGVGVTSVPVAQPEFHATRPFFYVITEEDTGAILFMGKVENPLLKE